MFVDEVVPLEAMLGNFFEVAPFELEDVTALTGELPIGAAPGTAGIFSFDSVIGASVFLPA
jgi:hypothetical protein